MIFGALPDISAAHEIRSIDKIPFCYRKVLSGSLPVQDFGLVQASSERYLESYLYQNHNQYFILPESTAGASDSKYDALPRVSTLCGPSRLRDGQTIISLSGFERAWSVGTETATFQRFRSRKCILIPELSIPFQKGASLVETGQTFLVSWFLERTPNIHQKRSEMDYELVSEAQAHHKVQQFTIIICKFTDCWKKK